MTSVEAGWRRTTARIAFAVAALGVIWTLYLAIAGGFDATVLGVLVSSHEPRRPFTIALLAFAVGILASGLKRSVSRGATVARAARDTVAADVERALADAEQIDGRAVVIALTLTTALFGLMWGTRSVGGSDTYGYVSQADLWLSRRLKQPQPWVDQVPWPDKPATFAPLGYRPVGPEGDRAIVPTYSPGLPLIMAAAKLVAGHRAVFWIVPLSGGLLILATYGLGRRLTPART